MPPQSPSKQASWDLTRFSQSLSAVLYYFPESHWWSEISSHLKALLVLGKARSLRAPNLGCSGAESPGWFDASPKNCRRYDAWGVKCHDEAANHQFPIAVAFWIIQIVSAEQCSSLMKHLMQICCSTCSVISNAAATLYTCSVKGVYHPHWLAQWSCHCSHMCIPVHSPWLPGNINVAQTILIILTMAGLFLDSHILIWFYE